MTPTIVNILTITIAFLSFLTACAAVFLLYRQIKKTHDWNRRKTSIELLESWVSGNIRDIWKYLETKYNFKMLFGEQNYKTVYESLPNEQEKQELKSTIVALLNHFEVISIGIKNHVYEEELIYDFAALHFVLFWEWAEPLINEYRVKDPTIFIEFRHYAVKWKDEVANEIEALRKPGKPAT